MVSNTVDLRGHAPAAFGAARVQEGLRWLHRLVAGLCLVMGVLLLAGQAHAQKVLLLTTNESGHQDGLDALNAVQQEFANAGATVTRKDQVLSAAGGINANTFSDSPGPYDIVLVASAYGVIDPSNWTVLQTAMLNRAANSFVMFVDGCCNVPQNMVKMMDALNAASGFGMVLGGPDNTLNQSYPLNTGSPYKASFDPGLAALYGQATTFISNVPAANALYLPHGAPAPAAGSTTSAYGLLVPIQQSNHGAGACLFAVNDLSPFIPEPWVNNQGKIGPAFLAATRSGGACGLPAEVSKAFAPTTVAPGQSSTLTITVSNASGILINGLSVRDNLPAPLQVSGPVSTTCAGSVVAPLHGTSVQVAGDLPPQGCTITVPVEWPASAALQCTQAAPGNSVTNTITPGVDFTVSSGQVNTPAVATLSCSAAPDLAVSVTASPTQTTPGGTAIYTITIANQGNAPAENTSLASVLPAGATVGAISAPCTGGFPCSLGTLAPGQTVSITVSVQVPPTAQIGNAFTLTANGSTTTPEPDTANNSGSATVTVATVQAPKAVPTLDQVALAVLGMLMLAMAGVRLRRAR